MVDKINFLSQSTSLILIITVSLIFALIGFLYSKNHQGINNYLIANRSAGFFSLTTSLVASALGAWILFGPSSAATWGGIGAVIGYSLGTAFPMIALIYLGRRIRDKFPKGITLIEFLRKRFQKNLFKLILLITIFYMFIFLCAEVTAIAILINYISGTALWITALIVLITTLSYTLYGGLRVSILTDTIQSLVVLVLFLMSVIYLISFSGSQFSLEFIKQNNPHLLSMTYLPNFTAGLTFFIAVAATNLFHQGNWQRVFSAKNNSILKSSLIYSSIIVFLIVFWMGYSGLISYAVNSEVIPDLAFFELLINNKNIFITIGILILAMSLTLSTIDTLINAISSLIIVNGDQINKSLSGKKIQKKTNLLILSLSFLVFILASKGYSILYLFLLADLFCCSAVITIFYGFFNKKINPKLASYSILTGLLFGLLFFPSQNFQSSILVGNLISIDNFSPFITSNLLFISFIISLMMPFIIILAYSFRNSFK